MPCGCRFFASHGFARGFLILNNKAYVILKCGFRSGTSRFCILFFARRAKNNIQMNDEYPAVAGKAAFEQGLHPAIKETNQWNHFLEILSLRPYLPTWAHRHALVGCGGTQILCGCGPGK